MNTEPKKILIIDDETSICKFLRVSLESNKYLAKDAQTGKDGLQELLSYKPDLIILDLGLPDMDGVDVLRSIREWSKVPIIVLTVLDSEADKIQALDAGADDYLTKPFSVPELLARIRVALRHAQTQTDSPVFRTGLLEVDLIGHLVKVSGKLIKLTATEFNILKVLIRHSGKVVTHRMLLNEVWGPNSVEHTQYLRVYLGQIRKKLRVTEDQVELIMTEPGVGYRLVSED